MFKVLQRIFYCSMSIAMLLPAFGYGADESDSELTHPKAALMQDVPRTLAERHCLHLLGYSGGGITPDFTFVLGIDGRRLKAEDKEAFNAAFARHVIAVWQLDSKASSCALTEIADTAGLDENLLPLPSHDRYFRADLHSGQGGPMQWVYQVSRVGKDGWQIDDVSISGRPLVANYRATLFRLWRAGGFAAVLHKLNG